MRSIIASSATLVFAMSFATLYGQTQQLQFITSSYPVSLPAGSAVNLSTVSLGVSYPTGLTPGSYILSTQLATDFQAFISAYPSPTDPPEAILSTVLQSILNKYPQMIGGTIIGEINGSETIGGISIPVPGSGGSVIVEIGTYNAAAGALIRNPARSKPGASR